MQTTPQPHDSKTTEPKIPVELPESACGIVGLLTAVQVHARTMVNQELGTGDGLVLFRLPGEAGKRLVP